MINFRYHLVSVTAVFLALAVGLILGTAALNGPTVDALSDTVSSLRNDNQALRDEIVELEEDVSTDQNLGSQIAPTVLKGTLAEQKVVLLSIGAADPTYLESVNTMIEYGEGSVVGQVSFLDAFTDPGNNGVLLDVVKETTPQGVEPPNNANGVESAAGLLAAAMLDSEPKTERGAADTILTALEELKLITIDAKPSAEATAVIVVTGKPYSDTEAAEKNTSVVTFTEQFAKTGPTVLASPTSVGEGNAVAEIVNDTDLTEKISTVDNVSRPEGQLATVLALNECIAGDVGHYGTGDGAISLVPQP